MSVPKKTRGLYARLMGDFHSHPKVLGLPLDAVGLWTVLASWSAHARKDGYFSERQAAALVAGRPHRKALSALIAARLVDPVEGGEYRLHGWDEHNMTRAEHEAHKEADRLRKETLRGVGGGKVVRLESRRNPGGQRDE